MLSAGTRLGPYEILSALGAGGMGEVYKARDTRLDRIVAIKVLRDALSVDAQFRERFDREARTISQLDHPHICALYDVGEQDGTSFLVMQYLEGDTLTARLEKGALPIDEALQYAIQIADALDKAHRTGIIHRDLKPGNVMLTKSGATLLDFGLAKGTPMIAGVGLSRLPTTPPLTQQGALLGTFQYMAPEQLEGKEADVRTDIFAFGTLVFEMATGRKAFAGSSHASLISSIMASQPPAVSALQPLAPSALDHIVTRCVAKDPEHRWQSARDLMHELVWVAESGPAAAPTPLATRSRRRERIAWTGAGLAVLALIGAAVAMLTRPAPSVEPSQFIILPPDKLSFINAAGAQALSPDGRQLAFVTSGATGGRLLWVRPLDSLTAHPLAGTDEAIQPFWSPDNRSIGFFARGKLKRIDATGGPPLTLADAPYPLGGTWSRQDVIVFGPALTQPLLRVPAGGGTPAPVTSRSTAEVHAGPSFLPDGRHFLFTVNSGTGGTPQAYIGSLDSRDRKPVLRAGYVAYSPPGYLLFTRESTLMAQPFDPARLSTTGDAVPLAEQVDSSFAVGWFAVSERDTLVYRSGTGVRQTQLVWVDRAGRPSGNAAPPGAYDNLVLSPDNTRVAFDRTGPTGVDVWLMDLQRRIPSRFTFQPPVNNMPVWSPDGKTVAFASRRNGLLDIYQRESNFSGPDASLLVLNAPPIMVPSDWSSRFLIYHRTDPKTRLDLWVLPLFGDRKPYAVLHDEFNESQGQFSPDGRWLAYVSDESGSPQIYVQSFPALTGKRQITADGGTQPRWRRDGKELFYLASDRNLMTVAVKTGEIFEPEAPRTLFETSLNVGAQRQTYSVTNDGQRFLLNAPLEAAASAPMTIVLNWPALLKK